MGALAFHFLIRKMKMLKERFWNILEYSPAIVLADPTESGQFGPFSGHNSAGLELEEVRAGRTEVGLKEKEAKLRDKIRGGASPFL